MKTFCEGELVKVIRYYSFLALKFMEMNSLFSFLISAMGGANRKYNKLVFFQFALQQLDSVCFL